VSRPEDHIWSCYKILCSDWGSPGTGATVWASDFSNSEVVFEISIHPEYGVIVVSQETDFRSEDWIDALDINGLPEGVLDEAINRLNNWAKELEIVKEWIDQEQWIVKPGFAVPDIQYAALAYAYSHRAEMNPGYVSELLAADMNVPLSTVKERLRKARLKGFLTSPGKGLAGQGKITSTAIKLLTKEGMLN